VRRATMALSKGLGSIGMAKVFRLLGDVHNDEGGAALVEYALLIGLIAVVCIVAVTQLGLAISGSLNTACTSLGGTGC
jgi:pilus assembly protein Flp/PilA